MKVIIVPGTGKRTVSDEQIELAIKIVNLKFELKKLKKRLKKLNNEK